MTTGDSVFGTVSRVFKKYICRHVEFVLKILLYYYTPNIFITIYFTRVNIEEFVCRIIQYYKWLFKCLYVTCCLL